MDSESPLCGFHIHMHQLPVTRRESADPRAITRRARDQDHQRIRVPKRAKPLQVFQALYQGLGGMLRWE